jgi:glutamine amidotransferase-like uncharacterized protein
MQLSRRAWLISAASVALASSSRIQAQGASSTGSQTDHQTDHQTGMLRVALLDAEGVNRVAFDAALTAMQPSFAVQVVTPREVQSGTLQGLHALVVTGGRASRQGRALGEAGREAIRQFVHQGGGYVGICAGSYLAMQRPHDSTEESYKVAFVALEHGTGDAWQRGIAPLRVRPLDGAPPCDLHYANGPIFHAREVPELPSVRVLARFEEEVFLESAGTHAGQMTGTPAIVATHYGEGQTVLFSPNPTMAPAHADLFVHAIARVASRSPVMTFSDLLSAP